MPEGDTIHRAAARLRPALEGKALVRFEAPRAVGRPPRPGTVIDAVEAIGKHLLVRFADGTTLRTHLRMTGSWHLYRTGERWQRGQHLARAVIEGGGWVPGGFRAPCREPGEVAVCFAAPVVGLEANDARIAHLGPALTRLDITDAEIDEAVRRMDAC